MEEKLYFKPADYGKGKKKAEKDKPKEKENHKVAKLIGILLFLLIVVVIIIWLLRGKITTTGQYPENVKIESLKCESAKIAYEKITKAASDKKKLEINGTFSGEEELRKLSLVYTLEFDNHEAVKEPEALAQSEFNLGLAAFNYSSESFGKKFSIYDNKMILSLSVEKNQLDQVAATYFLINPGDGIPKTLSEFRKTYENKGFSCTATTDK